MNAANPIAHITRRSLDQLDTELISLSSLIKKRGSE
jgi:hypothetical protein